MVVDSIRPELSGPVELAITWQSCFEGSLVFRGHFGDGDNDKITIDLLEFSLQQQEGNGIEEEEADVFSMVIITLMSAISKKLWKQKW